MAAGRSPDRFIRRGTRWFTAYDFFVCENSLLELDPISEDDALETAQVWQFDFQQIYNGLRPTYQEVEPWEWKENT